MEPVRSAIRSACAPLIVAAAIASAGVMCIWVHANDRTIGMLTVVGNLAFTTAATYLVQVSQSGSDLTTVGTS